MTQDEESYMKLGKELVRMIYDVRKVSGDEDGYARRKFTFNDGQVIVFVANSERVAELFEAAAKSGYENVENAIPPSTLN